MCSHSIMLCLVGLPSTHMGLKESCTTYDPKSVDHRARERTSFKARLGELIMPKCFLAILEKGPFYAFIEDHFAHIQANRIPRFQRKQSLEPLIITNIPVLSFTIRKSNLFKSNVIETAIESHRLGSVWIQVHYLRVLICLQLTNMDQKSFSQTFVKSL